jgi:hypothetical protein
MNKLERNDLLRFYDHFISPRSPSRRKLALHVNPSPLAFKTPGDDKHIPDNKNKLTVETGPSSTVKEGDTQSESSTPQNKLNEQKPIIDPEIQTDVKNLQKTLETENNKYEELHLPKVIILSIHFFITFFYFID